LKTCLLIDDDEDDRGIFELALRQLDQKFKCVTLDSGTQALETLKKGDLNPDYIFLDLNMPLITGRDCLIEIRKLSRFKQTPVLIYTTSSGEKDKEDVIKLGATSFITKPNKVSVLISVLREILNPS
jgi:CheY-like chemotaxis protein